MTYRLAAKLALLSLTLLAGAAAWLDYSLGSPYFFTPVQSRWDPRQ